MNVWMRGRAASRTAFQAASMSATCVRARPAITGPSTLARDRLHRLEVARRGDREAGLDHVDAEPRELLGDLQLLLRVQRDARRLLAVAQRRVEDRVLGWGRPSAHVIVLLSCLELWLLLGAGLAATCGRHALFPPKGEEKKSKVETKRHLRRRLPAALSRASPGDYSRVYSASICDAYWLRIERRLSFIVGVSSSPAGTQSQGRIVNRLICSTVRPTADILPRVAAGAQSTALVTGARGFVGAAVARRLRAEGWRVIGIDLATAGGACAIGAGPHSAPSGTELARECRSHDLTSPLPTAALDGVDVVIHAAALAGVQASWARPRAYWHANVDATRLLACSCRRAGAPRVLHVSSISVYGQGAALREDSTTRPVPTSFTAPAPGDPRTATVSSARAQRALGYGPRTTLRDGLARQFEATRGPVDWARPRIATA